MTKDNAGTIRSSFLFQTIIALLAAPAAPGMMTVLVVKSIFQPTSLVQTDTSQEHLDLCS